MVYGETEEPNKITMNYKPLQSITLHKLPPLMTHTKILLISNFQFPLHKSDILHDTNMFLLIRIIQSH